MSFGKREGFPGALPAQPEKRPSLMRELRKPENAAFRERVEELRGAYMLRDGGAEKYDQTELERVSEEGQALGIDKTALQKYITTPELPL